MADSAVKGQQVQLQESKDASDLANQLTKASESNNSSTQENGEASIMRQESDVNMKVELKEEDLVIPDVSQMPLMVLNAEDGPQLAQMNKKDSVKNKVTLGFEDLNADFALPRDFTKIKKLGKGAYGKVMSIIHTPSQREYACKRFEHVFYDDQRARRLLREMKILKMMKHPCCNRLLCVLTPKSIDAQRKRMANKEKVDGFQSDEEDNESEAMTTEADKFSEVYMVLRLADMDLKKLLKSSKHLEEAQVKSIVYDILCGLKYLHERKIIHRDLKPGNILVNDNCTIQICDFGLARSMDGIYLQEVDSDDDMGHELDKKEEKSYMPQRQRRVSVVGQMIKQVSKFKKKSGEQSMTPQKVNEIIRQNSPANASQLMQFKDLPKNARFEQIEDKRVNLVSEAEPTIPLKQTETGGLFKQNYAFDKEKSKGSQRSSDGSKSKELNTISEKSELDHLKSGDFQSVVSDGSSLALNQTLFKLCEDHQQLDDALLKDEQQYPHITLEPSSSTKNDGKAHEEDQDFSKLAPQVKSRVQDEEETKSVRMPEIKEEPHQKEESKKPPFLAKKPKLEKSKGANNKRKTLTKQLTKHVVTRWYRAPEVILMSDIYSYGIDIWALGCIFAELLNMMESNVACFADRQPLFPGHACYPLSPSAEKSTSADKEKKLKNDQLSKIFKVIGTPTDKDEVKTFLSDPKTIEYVSSFQGEEGYDFKDLYPGTEDRGINLLKQMLKLNPNQRITAAEAIKDPYFDDIRLEEQEKSSEPEIKLEFDEAGKQDMTVEELKKLIIAEINEINHFKFNFEGDFEEELCEDY